MNDVELLIDEKGNKHYVLINSVLDITDKNIEDFANGFNMLNNKVYYKKKLMHREDGPALEYINEVKVWYENGLIHRENGPAVEYFSGNQYWYKNGLKHKDDGPAVEFASGNKEYYINGIQISEENFYLEKELRESIINNNISKKNKI